MLYIALPGDYFVQARPIYLYSFDNRCSYDQNNRGDLRSSTSTDDWNHRNQCSMGADCTRFRTDGPALLLFDVCLARRSRDQHEGAV